MCRCYRGVMSVLWVLRSCYGCLMGVTEVLRVFRGLGVSPGRLRVTRPEALCVPDTSAAQTAGGGDGS